MFSNLALNLSCWQCKIQCGIQKYFLLQEKATVNNVETAIQDAEKACQDGTAGECAAAWDNVSAGLVQSHDLVQVSYQGA